MTAVPRYLQEFIREGKVIPFVGAGVSMTVRRRDDGARCYPSWWDLLDRAAQRLDQESKAQVAAQIRTLLEAGDYMGASTRARTALRSNWYRFLKSQFSFRREQIADDSLALARAIWGIGSNLIITTNYDRVLLWGCPELPDLHRWDIDAPYEQVMALRDGVEAPTLWHLHGLIDNVTKLVLTPDGYQRLYPETDSAVSADTRQRHQAALSSLQQHLASFSFLFIGFSLDDAAFLEQLQRVDRVFDGAAATHYILVREADQAAMVEKIEGWGLDIDVVTFADFGQPLVDTVVELSRYTGDWVTAPEALRARAEAPAQTPPMAEHDAEAHDHEDDDDDDASVSGSRARSRPPMEEVAKSEPIPAAPKPAASPAPAGGLEGAVYRGSSSRNKERNPFLDSSRGASKTMRSTKSSPSSEVLERVRRLSKSLESEALRDRRAAVRETTEVTRTVPLDDLLTLSRSAEPGGRMAAAIGLRVHLTGDEALAQDERVQVAVEQGLADPKPRVRYRFAEAVQDVPALVRRLQGQLETLRTDETGTVASKAREILGTLSKS